ncbi:hypothetical protein JTB14_019967 [Gonioctena quinquepunctata]|nr:hypothetical protein JTB14_019967 [Gonioctena quinquepunctata]
MREKWLMAIGLETLNWDAKPRVCSRHFTNDDFIIGGNIRKLKKCAIPNTLRLEPSCSNTQDLPTASSTTAMDTYEQIEHVPHHEEVETLSRNTKLSRSKDPLTEVSMSWSNRSGNRSEVNTEVNAFTPVCSNSSKQSHAEDQLNTFTSTPKKVFTNKTTKAANHFPMNMTWISKENAKAGDELTISTSRRSPLSQKSTLYDNILRNETSSDNMKSETCKSSCSKTIDILENEITYLNQEIKRLQEFLESPQEDITSSIKDDDLSTSPVKSPDHDVIDDSFVAGIAQDFSNVIQETVESLSFNQEPEIFSPKSIADTESVTTT